MAVGRPSFFGCRGLGKDQHPDPGRIIGGAVNAVGLLLEVLLGGLPDVTERLGIPVEQREPGALDVDHDPVALAEGVGDIGELEGDFGHFSGHKGLGFFETIAEFPPDDVPADEPLVVAHPDVQGIVLGVRRVPGVDVDDFDHPVGVCPGRRDVKFCGDGPGDLHIFGERIAGVDQNVGPGGGKPLVLDKIIPVVLGIRLHGVGDRFGRVADIFVEIRSR